MDCQASEVPIIDLKEPSGEGTLWFISTTSELDANAASYPGQPCSIRLPLTRWIPDCWVPFYF